LPTILYFISKYSIYDKTFLNKIGFKKEMIQNKANEDIIVKLFSKSSLSLIKFIIDDGSFIVTNECIDLAISNRNFEVIIYLFNNYEFVIDEDVLNQLFFLDNNKKNKNKRRRGLKRRVRRLRPSWIHKHNSRKRGLQVRKISNYEEYMITIISNVKEIKEKTLHNIFINSLTWLLNAHCFKLVNLLANKLKYDIKYHLTKDLLDTLIHDIIRDDDLITLLKLFESKIVLPITVSSGNKNMDIAIMSNSTTLIKYFNETLKMVCGNNMHIHFNGYRILNKKEFIKNLVLLEYPIDNKLIKSIVRAGRFDIIMDLIKDGKHIMPSFVIDYAILCKKYNLITKLLNSGTKIQKRNYIDKIIRFGNSRNNVFHYRFYFRSKKDRYLLTDTKQIDFLIDLGCTTNDSLSINFLAKNGSHDLVMLLHKYYGYKPTISAILVYFERFNRVNKIDCKQTIDYIEYVKNVMGINIFKSNEFTNTFNFSRLCELIASSSNPQQLIPLLTYFVKEGNIVVKLDHLRQSILYLHDSSYFEPIFEFFKEQNVLPDRDLFLTSIQNRYPVLTKYLVDKHQFTVTIKELHNMISRRDISLDSLISITDTLKIKITPYTVKLIIDTHLHHWYQCKYLKIMILTCKRIMEESYQMILRSNDIKLKKFLVEHKDQIKIVNYVPDVDEIPDVLPAVRALFDHDDFSSDDEDIKGDKDYVDEILAEYKV
ncbi:MAG: hypothetical protein Barrevirus4_25, partial [Barrevirus sp.]